MKKYYELKGNEEVSLPIESLNVYERINWKAKAGVNELDSEERERLEDILIENFSETVCRVSDEELLNMLIENGLVI